MRDWTAWSAVILVAMAVACGPSDDTEEIVRAALVQASIPGVTVAADEDVVRLSGSVDTLADRTRAVELATAIVGAARRVENDIAVTGLGPLGEGGAAAAGERR